MTGFATRSFNFGSQNYKIEIKSLNHRFMDLKLRVPREWSSFDLTLRSLVESKIKRGSVELWIERIQEQNNLPQSEIRVNWTQAEAVYKAFKEIQEKFKLTESLSVRDLISFPDVIQKNVTTSFSDLDLESLQKVMSQEISVALDDLVKMRSEEGSKLKVALLNILQNFRKSHERLLVQREEIQKKLKEKVRKRIDQCFEAYSTPDAQMRALMESRISQEISYSLDKLDIEEELTRFKAHLDQIELLLNSKTAIGKKIDFLFQELNREINTLGNKSQDLEVSQEVIQMKTWIEQMREQSLNLE